MTRDRYFLALIILSALLGVHIALLVTVRDLNQDIQRLQNTFNAYSHLLPTPEPTP